MTRWARAGNTQKHRKMPEDPTPWEEFASQRKTLAKTEKKFLGNKITKIGTEAAQTSLKKKIKQKLKKAKLRGQQLDSSLLIENKYNDMSLESHSTQNELDSHGGGLFGKHRESEIFSKKIKKKKILGFLSKGQEEEMEAPPKPKKLKAGKKKTNKGAVQISVTGDNENFDTNQTNLLVPHINKKQKTGKKKSTQFFVSDAKFDNEEERELITDSEDEKVAGESENEEESKTTDSDFSCKAAETTKSSHCGPERIVHWKNKPFFERVKEARAHNGILLLPKDVENRIYRLKRALREKGFPGEEIKKIARDARRKAEHAFKKTLKTCFNCRQVGHILANCPKMAEDSEQGTGICFKCGSTEHASHKCHIKTDEFPFAKCFVCHKIGHISRNCPENKNGIYPKGGKCNLCGSIYHMRKDCPKSFNKKGEEEMEITAHTINELRSVDDEIEEVESKPLKQKKPKVVKF